MPLFMVERRFAERIELDDPRIRLAAEIHPELGIEWLNSFLSADRMASYCLYEAPSPEALQELARRTGIPASAITEVQPLSL